MLRAIGFYEFWSLNGDFNIRGNFHETIIIVQTNVSRRHGTACVYEYGQATIARTLNSDLLNEKKKRLFFRLWFAYRIFTSIQCFSSNKTFKTMSTSSSVHYLHIAVIFWCLLPLKSSAFLSVFSLSCTNMLLCFFSFLPSLRRPSVRFFHVFLTPPIRSKLPSVFTRFS